MAAVMLVLCLAVVAIAICAILRPRRGSPDPDQHVTGPDKYDQDASSRVVGLIDLLFALVLTLPVLTSQAVLRAPWHSNVPVVLAIVLGYYVVIRSFIDWHIAMEDAPYWIRTSPKRSWELWRVYVDCAIVMAYVLLFLSAQSLAEHPRSDVGEYLLLFAVIFALYITWGQLRRMSYEKQHEFRWQTLATALVGFVAIWGAYRLERDHVHWLSAHPETRNIVAIALAFALYASYRRRNWAEMRKRRAVSAPASANEGVTI
jgi:hypothetical protein